jgi:polyphosphate:AMP phosphotransferase
MIKSIDLNRKLSRKDYKTQKPGLELKLGKLQRRAVDLKIPIVIVFEGWDAAGKGTLINELILPLDPRGFSVHSTFAPDEEEALRPFLWRFWIKTPARGRIEVFDRSWYRRVLNDRVDGELADSDVGRTFEDIRAFERQLADDGAVIVKFFLHISKKEQKERFEKLLKRKTTAWRVTKEDRRRHKQYGKYLAVTGTMLAETDADHAPWTIIEAHDRRFATVKIFETIIGSLETRISQEERSKKSRVKVAASNAGPMASSILGKVDLARTLDRGRYDTRLDRLQKELRDLEHRIYMERVPVVILYEGWDAAGKGGNLRRLTRKLDPRGYDVIPIGAPNDIEKAHHYLWRFWTQIPKAGHIAIFDRSHYGRVLVERVEGFCTRQEWKRAYREINEMEQHLVDYGTILLKFWLHIDPKEQLRRFKAREANPHKSWKITDEDWRNRKKHKQYEEAVEEMLFRTGTPCAPWTIVESNCKRYARIKVLETVVKAIRKRV